MLFDIFIILSIAAGVVLYYLYKIKPKMDPFSKAKSLSESNKLQEAVTEYKRALYAAPNDTTVHYRIVELYMKLNKIDEAKYSNR